MLAAKLLLRARGVPLSRRALAGALIEAERDGLIVGYIRGLVAAAKKGRR